MAGRQVTELENAFVCPNQALPGAVLFEHIDVLTPRADGSAAVMKDVFVAVCGGRIAAVTPEAETAKAQLPPGYLSYSGKTRLMLPGFANAHAHLAMTLMRNTADDLPLHEWLFNNIFPREARLRAEDIVCGSALAMAELIRGGTPCMADMYFMPPLVADLAAEAGVRLNICCEGVSRSADGRTELLADSAAAFVSRYHRAAGGRLRVSMLVHSVYLYPEPAYRELAALAEALDIGVQVHISETRREVENCLTQCGVRPPQKLFEAGILDRPTVAAHCVWLDDADRELLTRQHVVCAHNPISNLKLGSGIADVPAMQRAGMSVALGTDGAASNNRLDLYGEMRTAALLAKGRQTDPTLLSAAEVFAMATLNGYRALGYEHCGIIEPGAEADLQILRMDDAGLCPDADPVSAVVYSAGRENVESVLCAGRFLLYKGELTVLDEERIRRAAAKSAVYLA